MWIARMDTEHFDWIAAGDTRDQAVEALSQGWENHVQQYADRFEDDPPMDAERALEYYGAHIFEIGSGDCLRDDSLIASGVKVR